MTPIAPHIEPLLLEHLPQHRGASAHTCDSYAYSFQLLFEFGAKRLRVARSMMKLEQLHACLISAFLEHLETSRQNSAETRNIRLAAIRSFFRFLEHCQPAALQPIRRRLAFHFTRASSRVGRQPQRRFVHGWLDADRSRRQRCLSTHTASR